MNSAFSALPHLLCSILFQPPKNSHRRPNHNASGLYLSGCRPLCHFSNNHSTFWLTLFWTCFNHVKTNNNHLKSHHHQLWLTSWVTRHHQYMTSLPFHLQLHYSTSTNIWYLLLCMLLLLLLMQKFAWATVIETMAQDWQGKLFIVATVSTCSPISDYFIFVAWHNTNPLWIMPHSNATAFQCCPCDNRDGEWAEGTSEVTNGGIWEIPHGSVDTGILISKDRVSIGSNGNEHYISVEPRGIDPGPYCG